MIYFNFYSITFVNAFIVAKLQLRYVRRVEL